MTKPSILFIQNYATDPPHLVGRWLEEIGFAQSVVEAFAGTEIPRALGPEVKAVVALGGAMGALDDEIAPWLPAERALLRNTVETGTPVLGICLGAQLLGAALGGKVSRLPESEIGVYEIDQVSEDAIMSIGKSAPTTQWHEDYVSELPANATLIANSPGCPTQIYRVGELTYGLQCHPEADASIVSLWENKPDNAFKNFDKGEVATTVAANVQAREVELAEFWKPLIQNWGRAVLASR